MAHHTYDQAVEDRMLVPFDIYEARTPFQIEGIRPKDVPNEVMRELVEKAIEPEETNFEGTEIEKKVAVIGTNEGRKGIHGKRRGLRLAGF